MEEVNLFFSEDMPCFSEEEKEWSGGIDVGQIQDNKGDGKLFYFLRRQEYL